MGSRLYTVYLMKHKSDTFSCFKKYKAWAETRFERKIKVLRDDKGGEYMSNEMAQYLKEHVFRGSTLSGLHPSRMEQLKEATESWQKVSHACYQRPNSPHPSGEKP